MSGSKRQKMYPAGARPDKELVKPGSGTVSSRAPEKCFKAGHPFGLGLSTCTVNGRRGIPQLWRDCHAKGDMHSTETDATRQALEFFKQLAQSLDGDIMPMTTRRTTRRWFPQSALIFNPPSAYAVAKRDQPKVAEQLWTFHSPKQSVRPCNPYFWAVWNFSPPPAAKSLLGLSDDPPRVGKAGHCDVGFDIPPYDRVEWGFGQDLEEGPPKGSTNPTIIRTRHDATASLAGYPAPLRIGNPGTHPGPTLTKLIGQGDATAPILRRRDELGRKRDRRLYAIVAEPLRMPQDSLESVARTMHSPRTCRSC